MIGPDGLLFRLVLFLMVALAYRLLWRQWRSGALEKPGDPVCPSCGSRSLWAVGGGGVQRDICVVCGRFARRAIDCKAPDCEELVEAGAYFASRGFCAWHWSLVQLRERQEAEVGR